MSNWQGDRKRKIRLDTLNSVDFLIHAQMPSSIYSNTSVEFSELSGTTIHSMEIVSGNDDQLEQMRETQRYIEIAR